MAYSPIYEAPYTKNLLDTFVGPALQPRGKQWFVDGAVTVTRHGRDWKHAKKTISLAITAAAAGDTIYVAPGSYNETLAIPAAKKKLTIIGTGGRGAAFVEPTAVGAEGAQVQADDVTFVNLGIAGEATSDYALNVNGNKPGADKNGRRFRAYGCKFEGPTGANKPAVLLNGDANYQAADALFEDCEFAWANVGLQFDDSSYGYPTQIFVQNCRFHNITTACIGEATGGGVVNLEVTGCQFDNDEAGTAPTDYVKVDRAGDTGLFSGNRFAIATNAAADLKIAAGIKWAANATEAGWSTARPA